MNISKRGISIMLVAALFLTGCGGGGGGAAGGGTPGGTGGAVTTLATPSGVTATVNSSSQITLNWTAVTGATGYDVYRATAAGQALAAMTKLTATPTAATSYADTGLTAATAYYYKVVASNATSTSLASAEVTATTSAAAVATCTPGTLVANGSLLGSGTGLVAFGAATFTPASAVTSSQLSLCTYAFVEPAAAGAANPNGRQINVAIPATGPVSVQVTKPGIMVGTASGTLAQLGITFNGGSITFANTTVPTLASGNLVLNGTVGSGAPVDAVSGVVSTFAGTGVMGAVDGISTAASFWSPTGVVVDAASNVYVADSTNNKIRKITPTGVVSTLAGSGTAGAVDGIGAAASFSGPSRIAIDAAGNVYVSDNNNNKIRKINSTGTVSTFAGSGAFGAVDGTGTAASFSGPRGVAVDAAGNVYVADFANNKIRKITSAGVVSTLAGSGLMGAVDGTGTAASFWGPQGVAVDGAGNVYVADQNNNKIRKITPAGVVTTLAGSGIAVPPALDGTGAAATFNSPAGVAVDAVGNVYVADTLNSKIRKITPAGVVSTLAGSGLMGAADGTGTAASFFVPQGVAVDAAGIVYVADTSNNKIRKIQ